MHNEFTKRIHFYDDIQVLDDNFDTLNSLLKKKLMEKGIYTIIMPYKTI